MVFFLRRRSRLHRVDRSTMWWLPTARTSHLYGDGVTEHLIPPGTARSSFGTTVDHSESGHRPTYATIPPFQAPPVMAEMGRGNASRPTLVINIEGNGNNNSEQNRYSIASAGSDHSQYLIVSHRNSANPDQQVTTPMSVRPFSPSESFAFPKPPEPVAGSVAGTNSSRPTSRATSVTLGSPSRPPGLSSTLTPVPLGGSNSTKSPSSSTNRYVDPTTPTNPYVDPTTPTNDTSSYSHIPIKVIRRSFQPTLPDELAVKLDDRVRVLHTFDDGWGLIEKVGGEEERGLIPMACLKAGDELEELEGSQAGRRSSSYEGPHAI